MAEQDSNVLEILIGQMPEYRDIDSVLGKRSAYSEMPSVLSQSPISGITILRLTYLGIAGGMMRLVRAAVLLNIS
jgi:hypothetical protein